MGLIDSSEKVRGVTWAEEALGGRISSLKEDLIRDSGMIGEEVFEVVEPQTFNGDREHLGEEIVSIKNIIHILT